MPAKASRAFRLAATATLLGLAGLIALVILTRPEKPLVMQSPPAARVEAVAVSRQDFRPVERLGGRLQPWRRARLAFEVSGRVTERRAEPGERRRRGELLLALDARDAEAALAEAEARLALEEARLAGERERLALARKRAALQEKEVRRLDSLEGGSLVSATRREAARMRLAELRAQTATLAAEVGAAEARLDLRRAAVQRARLALERTRLRMPFDGVVDAVHLEIGDFARSAAPAVEVADDARLELRLAVRSAVAGALAPGRAVAVFLDGRRVAGRVTGVGAVPDPETWTHGLVVRLPPGVGRTGQWAVAELPLPPLEGVLAVPVTALLRDEAGTWLFRIEDGRLERVRVATGPRVGDWQVIRGGIREGERVVARDVAALGDGQRVEVLP